MNARRSLLAWLAALTLSSSCLSAGCSPGAPAAGLAAPVEVLALASLPGFQGEGEILHAQWVFEELEGLPPNSRQLQFTRRTSDVWAQTAAPYPYRIRLSVEPGGLAYDSGWDGEFFWEYNLETDPRLATRRRPEAQEIPASAFNLERFANPYSDLLEQARQSPDQLRDLGSGELAPWGAVRLIAFDWDGVTAQTAQYTGFPHTITFQVTEAGHWLVDWFDAIHAAEGEVIARHYQLTKWETLDLAAAPEDLWAFAPPAGVTVSEMQPMPEPTAEPAPGEPTRTIGEWSVTDLGYTPWVVGELPEAQATLTKVTATYGQYILSYDLDGKPALVLAQGLGLTEKWGNEPEVVELEWATVELGAIDPMGPPGWVALIRPHQNGDQQLPNVSLLVENPDRALVFQIIAALVPAGE